MMLLRQEVSLTRHFNRQSELSRRRALRRSSTEAEQKLWSHLRGKQIGAKFRRQYSVDAFVLDFYAPRLKLAIEVDGGGHFSDEATQRDRERTLRLQSFGIEVLRFSNLDVLHNINGVLTAIDETMKRRRLHAAIATDE